MSAEESGWGYSSAPDREASGRDVSETGIKSRDGADGDGDSESPIGISVKHS